MERVTATVSLRRDAESRDVDMTALNDEVFNNREDFLLVNILAAILVLTSSGFGSVALLLLEVLEFFPECVTVSLFLDRAISKYRKTLDDVLGQFMHYKLNI